MASQISEKTSFFDVVSFLLSNLVNGPSFMSISSLVLELWQFPFTRDWPEIRNSEMPPSEFSAIYRVWCWLRMQNVVRISLMKCYWLLQNTRVTAFTVSELLSENQQEERGEEGITHHQIMVNKGLIHLVLHYVVLVFFINTCYLF